MFIYYLYKTIVFFFYIYNLLRPEIFVKLQNKAERITETKISISSIKLNFIYSIVFTENPKSNYTQNSSNQLFNNRYIVDLIKINKIFDLKNKFRNVWWKLLLLYPLMIKLFNWLKMLHQQNMFKL